MKSAEPRRGTTRRDLWDLLHRNAGSWVEFDWREYSTNPKTLFRTAEAFRERGMALRCEGGGHRRCRWMMTEASSSR